MNLILGAISTLTPITHYVLIDLHYPANLMEFFRTIFPLVSFDLLDTEDFYEFIFRPSEFEDGSRSELYEWVGYEN